MQDAKELPAELNTCHEVILVQSNAIVAQKSQIDQLTKEREELRIVWIDAKSLFFGAIRIRSDDFDPRLCSTVARVPTNKLTLV